MLGNIYSTNVSAKRQTYRGKNWRATKAPVPILCTYHSCTIRFANAHAYIYINAPRKHKDIEGRVDGLVPLVHKRRREEVV